jgi:TonB-dependent starch-binding outer membrane protein SusC
MQMAKFGSPTIKGFAYTDPRTADAFNVKGRISTQNDENVNFITNATLNFNKRLDGDKHNVGLLAGVEYRSEANEATSSTAEGFPTPSFKYANSAANPISIGGFWTGFKKAAVFGQAKYSFASRYYIEGVMRYDGSSRFGRNTRWGLFPSISAAWVISDENFFKGIKVLDELKFRAGYGETGNDQIGNFPSLGLFGGGPAYSGIGGITANSLSNPDLRWERNAETSLGLEFSFFKHRVSGQIDAFDRKSKDLLLPQSVPQISGYSSITTNIGEVQNRGLEFELSVKPIKTKDFTWEISFNITKIDNKVTKLYDGINKTATKDSFTILSTTLIENNNIILGKPLRPIFTARYAGVNPATGRPMWYDENDNLTYIIRTPGDSKYLGSSLSTLYGGFTNSFDYKGFSVSGFFQYDIGRKAVNNQNAFLSENGGRLFNTLQDVYDRRWQKQGDITDVPRPFNGNAEIRGSGLASGSRFLEDASYRNCCKYFS